MSWFKGIVGGAIGAEALDLIKKYVEKQGGLDAVVKETLRLHPPLVILMRVVQEEIELAGRTIPAGTIVAFTTVQASACNGPASGATGSGAMGSGSTGPGCVPATTQAPSTTVLPTTTAVGTTTTSSTSTTTVAPTTTTVPPPPGIPAGNSPP